MLSQCRRDVAALGRAVDSARAEGAAITPAWFAAAPAYAALIAHFRRLWSPLVPAIGMLLRAGHGLARGTDDAARGGELVAALARVCGAAEGHPTLYAAIEAIAPDLVCDTVVCLLGDRDGR